MRPPKLQHFKGLLPLLTADVYPLCVPLPSRWSAPRAPSTRTTLGLRSPRVRSFAAHVVVDELPHRLDLLRPKGLRVRLVR